MSAQLMAVVTEGSNGRSYYEGAANQTQIAQSAQSLWAPGSRSAIGPVAPMLSNTA